MTYRLFIDDEREPAHSGFVIARSSAEAIEIISQRGLPLEIAFDHDLGGEDTAMRVVHWLTDQLIAGSLGFPENFSFTVHSQNPIGAKNIRELMHSLMVHFPPRAL